MESGKKTLAVVLLLLIGALLGGIVNNVAVSRRQHSLKVSASHNWDKLNLVLEQIDLNYVDKVDYEKITEKILPVLMRELDPHSVYLPPKSLEKADEDLQGGFEGIGITFNVPEDTAIIISVISGGPSSKAGLLSGDRILKVGERNVAGVKINQDTLVSLMKGPAGSKVDLDILREGELVRFEVERGKVPVKSIDVAYMLNDSTGYVKLSKFSRTSYTEFMKAASALAEKGMKRMIFDLRDNSGGYLDQALLLSNEFLPEGKIIVYMEGEHRSREEFRSDGRGKYQDVELFMLVNEGSASSSEIFAGAMQDNDRATIFGRRTFGKGVVQEPVYFGDNSGIRLTVARFYTATGRCIQRPYDSGNDGYEYDIYERYLHGEMTDADSIPVNDSLKFLTPAGKVVYGGGGIIPEVFVPIDTVGVSDLLVRINRQSYTVKYSSVLADRYRGELRKVTDLKSLEALLDRMDIEESFLKYLSENGVEVDMKQWNVSREVVLTQLRALTGRYSPLEDNAFYPIIDGIDNVMEVAENYCVPG